MTNNNINTQSIISQQYSSPNLSSMTQLQLQQSLKKFKTSYLPLWKFAAFIGYNFTAFSLIALYGYSFKYKFTKPGQKQNVNYKQLTLLNIIKKGTKHGVAISTLYIGGMYLLITNLFPFEIFYKLSEIQSKIHSFCIRYDPFYQQTMLFAKMRKFGLSQSLIQQIKLQLNNKKQFFIQNNQLKQTTVKHLKQSENWFQEKKSMIKGVQDFT